MNCPKVKSHFLRHSLEVQVKELTSTVHSNKLKIETETNLSGSITKDTAITSIFFKA